MQYVLMFGVMLISPVPCFFVLLRVDGQATEDPSAEQVENTEQDDLHRLILMGPNRSPSLAIFIPCLPLNFWVVPAITLCGFGY
jgi:hypothetical protein